MNAVELEEEIQDEIRKLCVECGLERLVAYWDDELEYYIYLEDSAVCSKCEHNVLHCESA